MMEMSGKFKEDYKNASLPLEDRVADLLSRLTLDEKIKQTDQFSSWGL